MITFAAATSPMLSPETVLFVFFPLFLLLSVLCLVWTQHMATTLIWDNGGLQRQGKVCKLLEFFETC